MAVARQSYNPLLKSFPDSERINSVSEGAEVLYLRLLAQSDDHGRYWAESKQVLAKLFTARMIAGEIKEKDVSRRLDELETAGLIRRYEVADKQYLLLVDCFKRIRHDVKIDVRFPKEVTDNADIYVTNAARARNARVASTQPNPTQPVTQPKEDTSYPLSPGGDDDSLPAGRPTEREFVGAWNEAESVRQIRSMTGARLKAFRARCKNQFWVEHWRQALAKFPLKCFGDGDWIPTADFFLRPDTVVGVIEGKYDWSKSDGRKTQLPTGARGGFDPNATGDID